MRTTLTLLWLGAAALVVAACGPEPIQRQPASADDGLHVTGRLDGRSLNVSVGEPDVLLGVCDPRRPDLTELCIDARTVDGERLGIVVNNPADLVAGETLTVAPTCPEQGCAGIARVEITHDGERIRATGGELRVREAGPRYTARFTLRVHTDTLTGGFDVLPAEGS